MTNVDRDTRVLLVEDNPGDQRLLLAMIEEAPRAAPWPTFDITHVDRLSAAVAAVGGAEFDLVLLDLSLPDSQGIDTFRGVLAAGPDLGVVVLTGLDDDEVALQTLHEGAQDYLTKNHLDAANLVRCMRYAIERNRLRVARDRYAEELRQAVDALEHKTQELDAFTYSVSHDLKEPLRTLASFSEFLLEDYADKLDERGEDYLRKLVRASTRMKTLIENLLTLSRVGRSSEAQVRVEPAALIDEIVEGMRSRVDETGAVIRVEDGLPALAVDASRLEQLFGNLISNGLKFNASSPPVIEIGVESVDGGTATFYVQDNGIGIDPQHHDRIFEMFQRLHPRDRYEGTGAGLAIVKRIVDVYGGHVRIDPACSNGTRFLLTLPVGNEASVVNEAA